MHQLPMVGSGSDSWWGLQTGVNIDLFGFRFAGAVGEDNVGDTRRDFYNVGFGATLGPVNTSIGYGRIFSANNAFNELTDIDKGRNLVISADVPLLPGLVLAGDLSFFNNDTTADTGTGDSGWAAVWRLAVAF